jgi:hypothetical protein
MRLGLPSVQDRPGESWNDPPIQNPRWVIPGKKYVREFENKTIGQFTVFTPLKMHNIITNSNKINQKKFWEELIRLLSLHKPFI